MERIVNFFNRTVDIGSWLISCIAIYVVMLPAVLMPLIMGQQLLFFNKKSFKVPKSDAFLLDLVAKMPRSAKLKGLNLRYPIAWRDFLLRNTMSTGKLRNMMFKISHFWDEKRPTKKSEDRIPTMLLPASPQPAIPRPALKDFWNNRRQESVPFVLKVHPSSPSRLSVHGPLWRTSETIGVGSYAIRFKSPSQRPVTDVRPRPAPTARSDGLLKQSAWEALPFVSKVHPSGPSRTSVHGPPPRPALKGFWNNRREELVPFVSKVHPSGPSRTSVHGPPPTARSDRLLKQSAWGTRAVCFKSPSQRPVTDVRPRPAPTARSDWLLKQSAQGSRAICFKSPSQRPVTDGRPRPAPHGPLWQTSETIGVRNSCRLFQKSIPAARHGRPSTARPPRPALTDFWNNRREELVPFVSKVHPSGPSRTAVHGPPPRPALTDFWNNWREELVPFVSKFYPSGPSRTSIHGPPPRPALTDFWNNRRKEAVPFVSKVHPSGPSRTSVHGPPPRPALTEFWNNRREELVPFVSKVHPSGPSRTSVHGPPPRSALTDFWNNRREKLVPFVSKVHPSGPSRTSVHGPPPRSALTDFCNNRRQESVSFVSKVHPSSPSRPAVHGPLSRPAMTDFWNIWRQKSTLSIFFRKPIAAARQGRPSTTRSHSPLWLT